MLLFAREWPVLLVDDDPDVLAVSQLAMKRVEVDGVPISLHTATSKAEAIKLLEGPLGGPVAPHVAVTFIDVVMETDQAGLELCEHIREKLNNRLMQIYIRTGQPGVAPERSVIDRYDINGYFSKVELTEDKLYSLLKAAVREFRFTSMALAEFAVVSGTLTHADSRESMTTYMNGFLSQLPLDGTSNPSHDYQRRLCFLYGDEFVTGAGYTPSEAIAERDRLLAKGLQPLGGPGEGYVVDGHDMLIKVAPTGLHRDAYHLSNSPSIAAPIDVLLLQQFSHSIATLWGTLPARAPAASASV
jgi:CheY-like chemotaxis protein